MHGHTPSFQVGEKALAKLLWADPTLLMAQNSQTLLQDFFFLIVKLIMLITDDFENIKQIFPLSIKKCSLLNSLIISHVKLIEGLVSRTLSRLTPCGLPPRTLHPMIEEQSAPCKWSLHLVSGLILAAFSFQEEEPRRVPLLVP